MTLGDQINKPAEPPPPPKTSDAEKARLQAWYVKVKTMHRWKRFVGIIGCIIAVVLLLLAKYTDAAQPWMMPAGLAIAGVSWLVFVWVIYDRWRWVKRNPYKPGA